MNDASPRWGGRRWWFPLILLGAALVVMLAVLALRGPTDYDPATPEGAAQGYVRAVVGRDHHDALGYLAPQLGCTISDFRFAYVPDSLSVRLLGTETVGDRVEVRLLFSEGLDSYQFRETLVLAGGHAAWLIVETPWPLYHCEREVGG